jgi:hypothetical protein
MFSPAEPSLENLECKVSLLQLTLKYCSLLSQVRDLRER